ncbi:MAG TPA: ribosome small subunit-dependent GTPase A [Nitriliruptorales bacterium]|nr:ribosome small subunit-dependent GTPase A [Nitriliruptorales bacterium]
MPRIDLEHVEEQWEGREEETARRPRPASARRDLASLPVGQVVGLHKGWVDVLLDGDELQAVYGGAMRGEPVVVGDRVRLRPPRRPNDRARVVDRLPRDSVLLRTADDLVAEERLMAANVDQVIAVVALDEGEVGARFVDRILVAAEAGGLDGAVCVNKVDLPGDASDITGRYGRVGYPVVHTSARTGEGLDRLRDLLAGCWTVMAGHSGVGKTSLSNLLVPGLPRQVGEVGRYGGRHTTAAPRALRVPQMDDAWLVDTPGVRSFGIAHVPPDELATTFPELRDLDCALPGCLHDGEPGCAVPRLLGRAVDPARYDSYRRFLTVLQGQPDTP